MNFPEAAVRDLANPAKLISDRDDAANAANPGATLRSLRHANGWTLADVAAKTGLPVSTISKIELGKVSLSYEKLARICTGLGIDIGSMFAAPAQSLESNDTTFGRRIVNRAGEGQLIETEVYSHLYAAAELLHKRFVPVIADIHARSLAEFGDLIRHPGEEFAYVLEGSLELHTELYAPTILNEGDSTYFDSGMGHAYVAVGKGPCRIISICSGEESQLMSAYNLKERPDPGAEAEKPRGRKTTPRGTTAK